MELKRYVAKNLKISFGRPKVEIKNSTEHRTKKLPNSELIPRDAIYRRGEGVEKKSLHRMTLDLNKPSSVSNSSQVVLLSSLSLAPCSTTAWFCPVTRSMANKSFDRLRWPHCFQFGLDTWGWSAHEIDEADKGRKRRKHDRGLIPLYRWTVITWK